MNEKNKLNQKRLMIHHIVVDNFKSYAGKHYIGPFHKNFTSVVGPNGSGKSNVIDSMLFVFGKRAKQIRQSKLSELIHNSEQHQNIKQASVTVYFQEIIDESDDSYQVVENSQFWVQRVVKKKGGSSYFINDKKSNFTEVISLLKERAIDLDHNRFLILQGEVEQIALMKPKAQSDHEEGLLEYLEDIIGSNRFIPLIEEAEKEVESFNEKRSAQLNVVKVIEKEKDSLEGAKNEAEDYLAKQKQLLEKKSILINLAGLKASKNIKSVEEKKLELEEKLEFERKKVEERTNELRSLEKTFKESQKVFEEILSEMNRSKADFAIFERKDIKCQESFKHNESSFKKLEKKIQKEEKKEQEHQKIKEESKKAIEDSEKKLQDLSDKLIQAEEVLEKMYKELQDKTTEIRNELEMKQKEIIPLNEDVSLWQSKKQVADAELKILIEKKESITKQLENLQISLEKNSKIIEENKKKIKENQKEERKKTKLLESLKQKNEKNSQEIEKLQHETRKISTQIDEEKKAREQTKSQGKLYDEIRKASKRGVLTGFHGRLGELGKINEKYDIAISTACSALYNLVLETTEDGQKCIEFLREFNLGRATCIILEKIEHLRKAMEAPIKTPENIPRLFDLIEFKKDSYKIAFYYALRDTLVAEDLSQAKRVAFNYKTRYRVVTLQGQLIDISGTMSGGGKKILKGGMNTKMDTPILSKQEMQEMEKKLLQKQEQLKQFENQKLEMEKQIKNLIDEISQHQLEIKKLNMAIDSLLAQNKEIEQQIPIFVSQSKEDPKDEKRIQTLNKSIIDFKKKLEKSVSKRDEVESEIEKLSQKIREVGGAKLAKQEEEVSSLKTNIEETNKIVAKSKALIKTSERTIERSKKTIENTKKEYTKVGEEKKKIVEEISQIEKEALVVRQAYLNAQKLLNKKEEEIKKQQKDYEELNQKLSNFRSIEVDIMNQLDDYKRFMKTNTQKTEQCKEEIAKLQKQFKRKIALNEEEELQIINSEEELEKFKEKDVQYEITILEETLEQLKPNMSAIQEYRKKEQEYSEKLTKLDQITSEREKARENYDNLRKNRLEEFMTGFAEITMKLKEMYQMITLGGDAELELVDSLDPFSEGILFSVRPAQKSWKNISNLSGGEKTLSSLALVFALHHYKPTPFYVMDEIDAALDFRNVSIVGNYIKERTKNAQFIIISLRNSMFELADRLVGIYKTHNCTKSIAIDPNSFSISKNVKNNNQKN
ncbi:structural maintenance of chromosomes protein [Anaeramoeba ignava]|uniref:Structural maintenance of chromosomes protein n=1 Tax=Anaeramoeba ignava TaxID=1746090 RepID=A0A9Q0R6R0_ANAIG|nr:structural maintenance of chromosomes protein [Anaeramoeba ignava]